MTEPRDTGDSESTRLERWAEGLLYPALPIAYGICRVIWRTAWIGGGRGAGPLIEVHGGPAIAMGIAFIALGMFLHYRFFWSRHPVWPVIGQVGEAASLIVGIGAVAYAHFSWFLGV